MKFAIEAVCTINHTAVYLPLKTFYRWLEYTESSGYYFDSIVFIGQDESLLHPHINQMLSKLRDAGYAIELHTSASPQVLKQLDKCAGYCDKIIIDIHPHQNLDDFLRKHGNKIEIEFKESIDDYENPLAMLTASEEIVMIGDNTSTPLSKNYLDSLIY